MYITVKCLIRHERYEGNQKMSTIKIEELNPSVLYFWKEVKLADAAKVSCHDFSEVIFILSGQGKYCIDGVIYHVAEGDLIVIDQGTKHMSLVSHPDNPTTEAMVGFADVKFEGYEENVVPLPSGEGPVIHTQGELRQRLFKIFTSMDAENAEPRCGRYYMLKAYLMQILLLLVREQTEPVEMNTGYSFKSVNKKYVVEQILNYFEDHYAEKISMDQIADNTYLSTVYISKIFKSEIGTTPIRHLINIRLEKAKELLEKGWEGSIQEVALAVGYDDAYHFSKLFKKHYGVSPSKVMKEAGKEHGYDNEGI